MPEDRKQKLRKLLIEKLMQEVKDGTVDTDTATKQLLEYTKVEEQRSVQQSSGNCVY